MATFATIPFYILLFLAGFCLAEVISIQNAKHGIGNTITDLSTRVRRSSEYNFGLGSGEEQPTELLDIVLVASVDGRLHALNRTSGVPLWSMSSSLNGEVPATLGPLVRTQHPKIDPDLVDENAEGQEVYVIEPQSGEIYVMTKPDAPLQRLPFTMPQLVDMSPFSFAGEGDSRVFVGRKETALLLVELETGKVKATLDSECPWDPFEDLAADNAQDEDLDLDELEGSKPPKFKPTEVFIGRTDYHISIRTRPTPGSKKPPVQKLSFSMYGPNKQDSSLQSLYRRTADDRYIESMPNGKVLSFRANIQDQGNPVSSDARLLWAQAFAHPIVAVFDVLRTPDREHPFVLLQPRPRLEDILPRDQLSVAAKKDLLPNRDSAYVGLVEETGSLYAMSPDRYPLVIFGDTNRHDEYGVGRSIDPPPDMRWDINGDGDDTDLPGDIDSIAKKMKMRQLCRNGSMDPRCLTGVRPLESSRLSRLLEGAPSVPFPPIPNDSNPVTHDAVNTRPSNNNTILAQLPGDDGTAGSNTQVYSIVGIFILTLLSALAWLRLKQRTATANVIHKVLPNAAHVDIKNPITPTEGVNGHINTSVVENDVDSTSTLNDDMGQRNYTAATSSAVQVRTSIPSRQSTSVLGSNGTYSVPAALPLTTRSFTPPPPPYDVRASTPTPRGKMAFAEPDSPGLTPRPMTPGVPERPRTPNTARPSTSAVGAAADGEDGGDGEESEGETPATAGKKKAPRRKRGKKKKPGAVNVVQDEEGKDGEGAGEGKKGEENGKDGSWEVVNIVSPSSIVVPPPITPKVVEPSLIVSDTILGFGSHGTVVYKGSLQGRAVAVKRLLQDFVTLAAREVNILQESDDHPNVIRYYYQEHHANFLYIALELCPASLADVIERPDVHRDISIAFDPKKALRQVTSGLRHLHALKIIHRDIKPQNILISHAKKGVGESAGHRMLISDFGLCKKLEMDQTSFLPTAHGAMAAGTVGWRAPEILKGEVKLDEGLNGEESMSSRGSTSTVDGNGSGTSSAASGRQTRLTKAVDIFALGCLFYYVLTNGGHPFGERFERESNIYKNEKSLEGLERFGEEGSEAVDLIAKMLSPEAAQRPDTSTILLHPYFWDAGKRLNFLQDASDRFEIMCRDPRDHNLVELERGAYDVVGADWNARLDRFFIENLGKFRKYDGKSVQDLLRALRNKKHHYQDLPDNVKRQVGPMPEGFLSYFTRRFPRLFLHVHLVIAESSLKSESMFRTYFELTD